MVKETKGPNAALGITDSNAAATSFSKLKEVMEVVNSSWKGRISSLFLKRRKLNIRLYSWVNDSKSLVDLTSRLTISSIKRPVSTDWATRRS